VACPPGSILFQGSCNSGGADRVQRGGTSVPRGGNSQSNASSGTPKRGLPAGKQVDPNKGILSRGGGGAATAIRGSGSTNGTLRRGGGGSTNAIRGSGPSNFKDRVN